MNPNQGDINRIIQQGYQINTSNFISRGWEIFSHNMGGFIGFFVISVLISLGLGFIPFIGNLAVVVVSGPLNAGNFIVSFKIIKRLPTTFGDFFKGFQNTYFLPVFLAGLLIGLMITLFWIPSIICYTLIVVSLLAQGTAAQDGNFSIASVPPVLGILVLVFSLLALIPTIYLSTSYIFTVPLIIGKKMQAWSAMEASRKLITKQWWSFFGFSVVLGLINLAGALLCGLGLLLTVPLTICAVAAAYTHIIGSPSFDPARADG